MSVEEKCESVGGWKVGVCCAVHVLFVNRPAGRKGTLGSIAPATQGHKARSGGRWREEERAGGNSICVRLYECMWTTFSAMALSATQETRLRGRRQRGSGGVE